MNKNPDKFKFGTTETVLLAVGTLAIDFISTSRNEIVDVQPGGKKLIYTKDEFEEKIKRYGIVKGAHHPGSSIGNFLSQVQKLTSMDPNYAPAHLATSIALKDPLAKILLKSLDDQHIQYDITDFKDATAANPIALLIESRGYTKILVYKDRAFPAIKVNDPKHGKTGFVIIGAAAGNTVETKQNALHYAIKNKLPIGMITTEDEINELIKNKALQGIIKEILHNASFLACNDDEIKKILYSENPGILLPRDKIALAKQVRDVFKNPKLDILLSLGPEGSLVLVGDTVVVQKIPDTDRSKIVSTAGAGDTLAAAFVHGVRMKGMDVEGVLWSLPRANRAAQNVLRYADTRSGQVTGEEFLEEPSEEFETEVISL